MNAFGSRPPEIASLNHHNGDPVHSNHSGGSAADAVPIAPPASGNGATPVVESPPCTTVVVCKVRPLLDDVERNYPFPPPIDKTFILNTVNAPVNAGREVVRHHHLQRFDGVFGAIQARLEGHALEMESNYAGLAARATRLDQAHQEMPVYREVPGDGKPWTVWSRCKAGAILVLSPVFILIDMNSVATTLKESGIASFQSPMRAWFFSAVPFGLALCLKLLRDALADLDRKIHQTSLTVLAILFGGLWLWFFATTFPQISQSTAGIVNSINLSSNSAAADSSQTGSWLILCGLAAAAFVAAASWTAVENIVESHQVPRLEPNLNYLKINGDLDQLRLVLEDHGVALSRTRKLIERIDNDRRDYLTEADNLYALAEVAVAYQKKAFQHYQNLHTTT